MSVEAMKAPENFFQEEVNNLHNVVEKEQKTTEYVTINDLTDKEKQELKERNRDIWMEIQYHIKNIMNDKLTDEQRENEITAILVLFWSNAEIEYKYEETSWINKQTKTHRIADFLRKVKDWKIPFENVKVSNMIMDNEHIQKVETLPGKYLYRQKISKITFSNI